MRLETDFEQQRLSLQTWYYHVRCAENKMTPWTPTCTHSLRNYSIPLWCPIALTRQLITTPCAFQFGTTTLTGHLIGHRERKLVFSLLPLS